MSDMEKIVFGIDGNPDALINSLNVSKKAIDDFFNYIKSQQGKNTISIFTEKGGDGEEDKLVAMGSLVRQLNNGVEVLVKNIDLMNNNWENARVTINKMKNDIQGGKNITSAFTAIIPTKATSDEVIKLNDLALRAAQIVNDFKLTEAQALKIFETVQSGKPVKIGPRTVDQEAQIQGFQKYANEYVKLVNKIIAKDNEAELVTKSAAKAKKRQIELIGQGERFTGSLPTVSTGKAADIKERLRDMVLKEEISTVNLRKMVTDIRRGTERRGEFLDVDINTYTKAKKLLRDYYDEVKNEQIKANEKEKQLRLESQKTTMDVINTELAARRKAEEEKRKLAEETKRLEDKTYKDRVKQVVKQLENEQRLADLSYQQKIDVNNAIIAEAHRAAQEQEQLANRRKVDDFLIGRQTQVGLTSAQQLDIESLRQKTVSQLAGLGAVTREDVTQTLKNYYTKDLSLMSHNERTKAAIAKIYIDKMNSMRVDNLIQNEIIEKKITVANKREFNNRILELKKYVAANKLSMTEVEYIWKTGNVRMTGASQVHYNHVKDIIDKTRRVMNEQPIKTLTPKETIGQLFNPKNLTRMFGISLMYRSIYGTIRAFREGSRAALEFNKRLAEIQTISTATTLTNDKLANSLFRISSKFGAGNALQQAEAFYQILSNQIGQGYVAVRALEEINKLSLAGVASVEKTTETFTAIVNAFGLTAADYSDVSSFLFDVVNYGKVRLEEMGSSLGEVAIMASQAGLTLEELGAMWSLITIKGSNFTKSNTQIRNILLKLLKPTKEMTAALQQYGFETPAIAVKALGFEKVLELLSQQIKGSNEQLVKMFPNMRGLAGAMLITNNASVDLNKELDKFKNSTTDINDKTDIMMNTFENQWQRFKNAMSNVFTSISLGIFKSLYKDGGLLKVVETLEAMIESANVLGSSITSLLWPFRQLSNIFSDLIYKGKELKEILYDLKSAEDTAESINDLMFQSKSKKFFEDIKGYKAEQVKVFQAEQAKIANVFFESKKNFDRVNAEFLAQQYKYNNENNLFITNLKSTIKMYKDNINKIGESITSVIKGLNDSIERSREEQFDLMFESMHPEQKLKALEDKIAYHRQQSVIAANQGNEEAFNKHREAISKTLQEYDQLYRKYNLPMLDEYYQAQDDYYERQRQLSQERDPKRRAELKRDLRELELRLRQLQPIIDSNQYRAYTFEKQEFLNDKLNDEIGLRDRLIIQMQKQAFWYNYMQNANQANVFEVMRLDKIIKSFDPSKIKDLPTVAMELRDRVLGPIEELNFEKIFSGMSTAKIDYIKNAIKNSIQGINFKEYESLTPEKRQELLRNQLYDVANIAYDPLLTTGLKSDEAYNTQLLIRDNLKIVFDEFLTQLDLTNLQNTQEAKIYEKNMAQAILDNTKMNYAFYDSDNPIYKWLTSTGTSDAYTEASNNIIKAIQDLNVSRNEQEVLNQKVQQANGYLYTIQEDIKKLTTLAELEAYERGDFQIYNKMLENLTGKKLTFEDIPGELKYKKLAEDIKEDPYLKAREESRPAWLGTSTAITGILGAIAGAIVFNLPGALIGGGLAAAANIKYFNYKESEAIKERKEEITKKQFGYDISLQSIEDAIKKGIDLDIIFKDREKLIKEYTKMDLSVLPELEKYNRLNKDLALNPDLTKKQKDKLAEEYFGIGITLKEVASNFQKGLNEGTFTLKDLENYAYLNGREVGITVNESYIKSFYTGIKSIGNFNLYSPSGFGFGFATGGYATDTLNAMLTPGEFVVRRNGVNGNIRTLLKMNRGQLRLDGFGNGGMITNNINLNSTGSGPLDARRMIAAINREQQHGTARVW